MNRIIDILLVDDDEAVRDSICAVLDETRFSIDTAEDGHKALSLIKEKKYDLIIADIIMDGMDGMELLRTLRKGQSKTPTICMSGNSVGSHFLETSRLMGVSATLQKPFSKDELLSAIEFALTEQNKSD